MTTFISAYADKLGGFIASGACPDSGATSSQFGTMALELFARQFEHNAAYRRLCLAQGAAPETVEEWSAIPAAPTSAFKELELTCLPPSERTTVFHSSGTTEQRPSRHFHSAESLALYELSLRTWFASHLLVGRTERIRVAFLTPPPDSAPHSSLAHMCETVRQSFGNENSFFAGMIADTGAWELDLGRVLDALDETERTCQPVALLGTAFNFVHLLDELTARGRRFQLPAGSRVMETGGYKGRSRVLEKPALHQLIEDALGIPRSRIVCEYGMSELSSQAYDRSVGFDQDASVSVLANGPSREISPLTPALSPLRGEGARRVSEVMPALPAAFGAESMSAGELRARQRASQSPPAFSATPSPLNGERAGVRGETAPERHATLDVPPAPRLFRSPPWARFLVVSPETGRPAPEGQPGLLRVFDLANVASVLAVQTEDLAVQRGDGFELLGRAALSEPRGCSLMSAR